MMAMVRTQTQPQAEQTTALTHMLRRLQPAPTAWQGVLPEAIGTDGAIARSLHSQAKQIIYHESAAQAVAKRLLGQIDSCVNRPGASFSGYTRFKTHKQVAFLRAGSLQDSSWLAYPCEPGDIEPDTMPTSIAAQTARVRIVGGAALVWRMRQLCIQVALEQRGDTPTTLPAGDLLAQIERLELCAVTQRGVQLRRVELVRQPEPLGGLRTPSPGRLEASFAIESSIYKEYRAANGQLWLLVQLSRNLMPLPPEWATFWFQLELTEPHGVMI
jgi:hypothetical protein